MSEPHSHGPSTLALLGLLLLGVTAGGFYTIRTEFMAQHAAESDARAQQVAAIQQQLATLALPAATDTSLKEPLVAIEKSLAAIEQRLTALEANAPVTTPTPVTDSAGLRQLRTLERQVLHGEPFATALDAVATLPAVPAEAVAALRVFAATGVPDESTLRDRFRRTLDSIGTPDDTLTQRLGGLVTIKRRITGTQDNYTALRALPADAAIATIATSIQSLPEAARAPFADWLDTAAKRTQAMTALDTLATALLG